MPLTTPKPCVHVPDILPELAGRAVTTVRLHPRPGTVTDVAASKLGGTFLWPAEEAWPVCKSVSKPSWWSEPWPVPKGAQVPLVPILQLRADDFPEMRFPDGTDLFQLLWCPLPHGRPGALVEPAVFWRDAKAVAVPLTEPPETPSFEYRLRGHPTALRLGYYPTPCCLHPERVAEYPHIDDLTPRQRKRLERCNFDLDRIRVFEVEVDGASDIDPEDLDLEGPEDYYEWLLSVCPGTKVGGYVFWSQAKQVPVCDCGSAMDHLLTIAADEWDGGTRHRWMPVEDQWRESVGNKVNCDPADFAIGGSLYLFVCHQCPGWPVRSVCQRG